MLYLENAYQQFIKCCYAEDLDIVMPMLNLPEYSDNFLWNQEVCGINI